MPHIPTECQYTVIKISRYSTILTFLDNSVFQDLLPLTNNYFPYWFPLYSTYERVLCTCPSRSDWLHSSYPPCSINVEANDMIYPFLITEWYSIVDITTFFIYPSVLVCLFFQISATVNNSTMNIGKRLCKIHAFVNDGMYKFTVCKQNQ